MLTENGKRIIKALTLTNTITMKMINLGLNNPIGIVHLTMEKILEIARTQRKAK